MKEATALCISSGADYMLPAKNWRQELGMCGGSPSARLCACWHWLLHAPVGRRVHEGPKGWYT
eukprot:10248052-Ditylum_brightwellii.AAC.1